VIVEGRKTELELLKGMVVNVQPFRAVSYYVFCILWVICSWFSNNAYIDLYLKIDKKEFFFQDWPIVNRNKRSRFLLPQKSLYISEK
jgi:hypothetical protein